MISIPLIPERLPALYTSCGLAPRVRMSSNLANSFMGFIPCSKSIDGSGSVPIVGVRCRPEGSGVMTSAFSFWRVRWPRRLPAQLLSWPSSPRIQGQISPDCHGQSQQWARQLARSAMEAGGRAPPHRSREDRQMVPRSCARAALSKGKRGIVPKGRDARHHMSGMRAKARARASMRRGAALSFLPRQTSRATTNETSAVTRCSPANGAQAWPRAASSARGGRGLKNYSR